MSNFKLLIDGKLVNGDDELEVIHPADEEVLARCARASAGHADEAVAAAEAVFPSWAAKPLAERREIIPRLADAIEKHAPELAWSTDRELARDLDPRIDAGTIWINKHLDLSPTTLFGGSKRSAAGAEFAEEGLHEFTQLHAIDEAK